MFRIRDCEKCILSLFYQKNSNELSRTPGHENIRAELAITRPNDLPTAIKGHREWDKDSISYKLDQSPAVISFVESRGVIGIRKKVRNEIRAEVSIIKYTDFDAVATSRNLTPEEAKFLKFDSERSVVDTMALKRFYMWNLYGGNDMSIEDWNKLCDKDFVELYSPPELRKHFLHLSHFCKQGYNEDNAIEELKAKDLAQWEDTCYNARDNFEDSVAKDLRKTYSANHWIAVKVAFKASREKFIKIRSQALLLFGFRSRAKEMPDLKSAIKAINAIVEEIMAIKLDNPKYVSINPILPSYKPKINDEIQDFFDSIPTCLDTSSAITNNITSEYIEHEVSGLTSNVIDEKALFLESLANNQTINSSQDICHVDTTICEVSISEKKIQWLTKP
ncbi:hypothetical protein Glove_966g8 [Diversispora epigaea]|uniref:Uncharacterized protein n=1 Tax=Diversispora epigaea TaxID=1348612 RepID=A0A397G680_9GLOM|nr:hypothetical protein Glove_966g8 [Diversispora epigaea]